MNEIDVICRYRDPVKAPLLRATVVPAAREAQRTGVRVHLERHWRHGPHVTVALAGDERTAAVAQRVAELLTAGLSRHPSTSSLTDAELLAASERSGRAELVPGPYEPIEADNTVQVVPAARGHLVDLLGGPGAVAVRAAMLADALDVVEAVVGATPCRSSARVSMTVAALAVHAGHYGHGLLGGYLSFVSHLEDFLFLHDTDGAVRARFTQVWETDGARVTRRVEQALDPDRRDGVTAAWDTWSGRALTLAERGFAAGDVPLLPGDAYRRRAVEQGDPAARRQWDRADHDRSEFHARVGPLFDVSAVAEVFGPYRFATNVLYQVLLLADVTPIERYLAAYLLGRAVTAITGSDWRQVVAQLETAS